MTVARVIAFKYIANVHEPLDINEKRFVVMVYNTMAQIAPCEGNIEIIFFKGSFTLAMFVSKTVSDSNT